MKYRYALVTIDDRRDINLMRFKKIEEAQKQMVEELRKALVPRVYSDEVFKKKCEEYGEGCFGIGTTSAWVSVDWLGWMEMEIFDLKKHKTIKKNGGN